MIKKIHGASVGNNYVVVEQYFMASFDPQTGYESYDIPGQKSWHGAIEINQKHNVNYLLPFNLDEYFPGYSGAAIPTVADYKTHMIHFVGNGPIYHNGTII